MTRDCNANESFSSIPPSIPVSPLPFWHHTSILNILKNVAYTGIRKFGDSHSDVIPHLQIIEKDIFLLAQKQVEKNKLFKPAGPHLLYAASVLFAGLLHCMHCGKKMSVTRSKKTRQNKNGIKIVNESLKYTCVNRSSGKPCDGQWNYSSRAIDEFLSNVIDDFLFSEDVEHTLACRKEIDAVSEEIREIKIAQRRENQSLEDLKSEVIEVIRGTSAFGSVLLSDLIKKSEGRIAELENEILLLNGVERKQKLQMIKYREICRQFDASQSVTLASLELGEQQVVVQQIVDRIYIGSGYKYRVEWSFGGYFQG